jgi:hypothetical protein
MFLVGVAFVWGMLRGRKGAIAPATSRETKLAVSGFLVGRRVRRLLGVIAAVVVMTSTTEAQDNSEWDVSGTWWGQRYSLSLELVGGGAPPLNEAGQQKYAENIAGLEDGSILDEARRLCVPDGVPRILAGPYPFRIVHTPGQTTILYELNGVVRFVGMDRPQYPDEELEILPRYSGYSVGRWEDDTLIIETAGFNEKTFIDVTGTPHSYQMTTVERIRKLDDGTLENVITVTDPSYYTEPFSARFVYDHYPSMRLRDYVCGEPHRDISHIPGVAEARQSLRPFNR